MIILLGALLIAAWLATIGFVGALYRSNELFSVPGVVVLSISPVLVITSTMFLMTLTAQSRS